jgi:hypothetical protein
VSHYLTLGNHLEDDEPYGDAARRCGISIPANSPRESLMNDDPDTPRTQITIRATDYASANLNARIAEFRKRDAHIELDPSTKSIQFLRGVAGRATFVLPALYAQWGAQISLADRSQLYWQRVQAANADYSSLQTISLACRAIFDDSNDGMTGKNFAKVTDAGLRLVADYWSESSGQSITDALKALNLLRSLFKRCSHPSKKLFDASSLLERRVGLVKYHADRLAAHITLQTYLFHTWDLVHVVAAIAVVGAMIIEFDDKTRGNQYFDAIDEAAWQAAVNTFPRMSGNRLFHAFNIHQQARAYRKTAGLDGLHMLLNQLPSAIGYWDDTAERPI